MEPEHKQADATGALASSLQTAANTAAANVPAAVPAAKQRADAVRKQGRKPRVFYRSKVVSGTSQSTATAHCADTAVSKQTTNDTRTLPTLAGDKQTCRPTVSPTDCMQSAYSSGRITVFFYTRPRLIQY